MSHSSWDYSSRIIPTRYESRFHDSDFWRPRWEVTPVHHTPMHHTPMHHTPPFPTTSFQTTSFPSTSFPSLPPPPPEFSSSLVHYPSRDRQMGDFDNEMKRMNAEMGKMFNSMQKFTPPTNVDDWRLSENFRMENPIQNYGDGTRKFQLQFDMRQFKPEEINVKTSGNTLTVQAKHDEKDPNKSVFREYNRSYVLPKDVQPERLTSKLSTEGVLCIEAPLPAIEGPREKLIPIKHN